MEDLIINIFLFLAFLGDITLTCLIFAKASKKESNTAFGLSSLSVGMWTLGVLLFRLTNNLDAALLLNREYIFASGLIASTFLHFAYLFTGRNLNPWQKTLLHIPNLLILIGVFVPDALIRTIIVRDWGKESILGGYYWLFGIYFSAYVLYALYLIFVAALKAKGTSKTQLWYVFFGTILTSLVGTYFNLYLILLGNYRYIWVGPYNSFFLVSIITFAILRHRLMDIEVVIKRSIVYSVLTALIIGVYTLVIFASQELFANFLGLRWLLIFIGSALIAIGFKPLEMMFTNLTDKFFFQRKYEYRETLKRLSAQLNQLMPLRTFVWLMAKRIYEAVRLEGISCAVYNDADNSFAVLAIRGNHAALARRTFADDSVLIKGLKDREYVLRDEASDDIREEMTKLGASLIVPGRYDKRITCVFMLGEKKSQDPFSDEDMDLFTTLSAQAGMALANVKIYSQAIERFEKERSKAEAYEKQLERSARLASLGTLAARGGARDKKSARHGPGRDRSARESSQDH